jgi:hypothetical protein
MAQRPAKKGAAKAGCWPLARRAQHEIHAIADVKRRLIAILLKAKRTIVQVPIA